MESFKVCFVCNGEIIRVKCKSLVDVYDFVEVNEVRSYVIEKYLDDKLVGYVK